MRKDEWLLFEGHDKAHCITYGDDRQKAYFTLCEQEFEGVNIELEDADQLGEEKVCSECLNAFRSMM